MDHPKKLDCLDGLRALAVLQVILFHHRLVGQYQDVHPWFYKCLAPSRFGFAGVHLFLVLSGFCLTHSLIRRARSGRASSLFPYLRDRWWRIAPPYYAAMAAYLGVILACDGAGVEFAASGHASWRQIWRHLAFVHGLDHDLFHGISPSFWSLSLEFQFYLVLPLLFVLAGRFGPMRVVAFVVASSLIWRLCMDRIAPGQYFLIAGVFLGRWTEFALGIGVAFWYNRPGRGLAGRAGALAGAVCAAAMLGVAVAVAAVRPTSYMDYLFGIGYAILLVAALLAHESGGRLARWLSARPIVWVGSISYSLYLTHNLVIDWEYRVYRCFVGRPTSATEAALFAAAIGSVLVLGWSFHHAVERRFLRPLAA